MQVIPVTEINEGTVDRLDSLYIISGEADRYDPVTSGDHCMVFRGNQEGVYVYRYDASSTETEVFPRVIAPLYDEPGVPHTGPGRWIFKAFFSFCTADFVMQPFGIDTDIAVDENEVAVLIIDRLAGEEINKLTFALYDPGDGDVVVNVVQRTPAGVESDVLTANVTLNSSNPVVEVTTGFTAAASLDLNNTLIAKVVSSGGTVISKGLLVGVQTTANLEHLPVTTDVDVTRIPIRVPGGYSNSPMYTDNGRIVCEKIFKAPSVETDTGSWRLDDIITISSNSVGINLKDNARLRNYFNIQAQYDSDKSFLPVWPKIEGEQLVNVFSGEAEESGDFYFTNTIPSTAGREGIFWHNFLVKAAEVGTGVFTIKYSDVDGKTIVTRTEFTVEAGDIGILKDVELENSLYLYNGETTYVSYSGPNLKGETDGAEFKPYLSIVEQNFNEKDLSTAAEPPIEITSSLTITAANYGEYKGRVIEGAHSTSLIGVYLPVLSTITDTNGVLFTIANKSTDCTAMDILAGSGNTIGGAQFKRLLCNESITVQRPRVGETDWVITNWVTDEGPEYITSGATISIPISARNIFVKYTNFSSGTEIVQPLPPISAFGDNARLYFQNADTDRSHSVRFTPDGTDTVDGGSEFEISGDGELVEFVSDATNNNWILASLHFDQSAVTSKLELDDGTTNIGGVTKITYDKAEISGTSDNVTVSPQITFSQSFDPFTSKTGKELSVQYPLEIQAGPADPVLNIYAGAYESQHVPGYYASLSDDTEVVGLTSSGIRTGVLWFDNVIKPAGVYIDDDKVGKRIGLQEDDTLDPNVTGGTPYFIYTRVALKGTAPAAGYVQLFLRDATTKDIIEDDLGNVLAVRKQYAADEELGALDIAAIKKYTGLEYFQICVDENFGQDEPIIIEDRTEGNSCVLIQAINTDDQTSRGILQCENDLGKNFEWTAHYLGDDLYTVQYYLKEDRALTTITAGTGETGADGWYLNNFTSMKVGVASDTLTLEDDGINLCGFSFGKVISAEKTQLLRNKVINAYITTTTPVGAGRVYAAKWTGAPDQYTGAVITGIDGAGTPIMGADWTLLGTSIFCTEDASGDPNTYSGAFTVPTDAINFTIFFAPQEEQQPNKFEITDFHADVASPFNGYFLHAPEEAGEKHLIKDLKYFECGLNTEGYSSLRYTINTADTPMPAGKQIKGKADIEANWAGTGGAVDFLTFNEDGDADIATTYNVYPGESIPAAGSTTVNFWWSYENPADTWNKITESERSFTINKDDPPTLLSIPSFTYKAKNGDKLRAFASAGINDGAYIQTVSPHVYLCETTIDFQEFTPGSEDAPLTSLWVEDSLTNLWELTAETDGRLLTLLQDDLPANQKRHVIQDDFSLNDFELTGDSVSIVDKAVKQEYTEINADTELDDYHNYNVNTTLNTVTINIPYEQKTGFTVRDAAKKFSTNNCIITIRDSLNAIVHTATLDKKDTGYIFYNEGGTENDWKYGEIGKGLITDIASSHTASTDFGYMDFDMDDWSCKMLKEAICYDSLSVMADEDEALVHRHYVDNPPMGGGYSNGTGTTVECTTSGSYYKIPADFTSWANMVDFTWDSTNKRYKYTGSNTHDLFLTLDFTGGSDTNNVTYTVRVYKNGSAVSGIEAVRTINSGSSGRVGLNGMVSLAENDYIELYVSSDSTAAPEFTLNHCQLTIRR